MVTGQAQTKAAADKQVAKYQAQGYTLTSPPVLGSDGRWRFALDK